MTNILWTWLGVAVGILIGFVITPYVIRKIGDKQSKFKEMASYGVHSLRVLVSDRLLRQSAPILIPYFLPVQFLAYYSVPMRILDYMMDGIGRVGTVTTPNATELMATGRRAELINLGVYANRYSLALFLPVTIFLLVFGSEIYGLWIRPDFAAQSAYLLPAFLFGHTLASSQFNSASILFGLGRHQAYSKTLLAEAILSIVGNDPGVASFWAVGRRLAYERVDGIESRRLGLPLDMPGVGSECLATRF